MARMLMILEVARKQAYIFASRRLKDNLQRSEEIRYVTSTEFFQEFGESLFREKDHLVYTGGGHSVLQFESEEDAREFAAALTERVLRQFPEMELFVKLLPYDPTKSPGENLQALSAALEAKKARRRASFYRRPVGFSEKPTPVDSYPSVCLRTQAPDGWTLTDENDKLAGEDSYLAVVQIDGNAMSKRVQEIYEEEKNSWEKCREKLQCFSKRIDQDYAAAFQEMTEALAKKLPKMNYFPVRKIIGAGDDVCFITAGSLGIECAVSFLERLSQKTNEADQKPYTACAGVVLIHKKYPFRQARDLSEELCRSAKSFDPSGKISAIDWHISPGQLKSSLEEIESDYRTDDGCLLTLRPYVVAGGENVPRQYSCFRSLVKQLQDKTLPRSKVLRLREAMKQGEAETRLAILQMQMEDILYLGVEDREPQWLPKTISGQMPAKDAFYTEKIGEKSVRRCLFFDAIELMEHMELWREEK